MLGWNRSIVVIVMSVSYLSPKFGSSVQRLERGYDGGDYIDNISVYGKPKDSKDTLDKKTDLRKS